MAMRFTVGFEESYFVLDGAAALHILCTASETASSTLLLSFDVTLRSTNGRHVQSFSGVSMPEGSTSVRIPFAVPLDWADDFAQNIGDTAHADACGQFLVSMTAHCTLYAGTLVFRNDYSGYAAAISGSVPADILPAAGALSVAAVDGKVPSDWGIYVQGVSRVRITAPAAAGAAGSSIAAYFFGADGAARSENWAEFTLTQSGNVAIPVTVQDSRGRTATQDLLLAVQPYAAPALTGVRSLRCGADGTADENGVCFQARYALAASTLGGKNPAAVTCAWKKVTDTAYGAARTLVGDGAVLAAALEAGASYEVKYTVSDAFYSIDTYDYVSSTVYLLHFRKGGTGIAVGKAAEAENLFDVGLNADFRRAVTEGGALNVAGALTLGGTDVSAALANLGSVSTSAVAVNAAAMPSTEENTVLRCGRLVLTRLRGTLQNDQNAGAPPYEGVQYRVGSLPAGYYAAASVPLAFACQNGKPCKGMADSAGNLYVIPAADGQTSTELYTIGIV